MEKRNEEILEKFEVMQETIEFMNKANDLMDELSEGDLKNLDRIKISLIRLSTIHQSAMAAATMSEDLLKMLMFLFNEGRKGMTSKKEGN